MREVENLVMPEVIDGEISEEIIGLRCYTVNDLQLILGIGRNAVYKLLAQQEFRWVRIGNLYRIPKKGFDEWLESRT